MKESAGGIFTERPFEPNTKCLVIAAAAVVAYWVIPKGNVFLIPVIFIIVYILIAWYDFVYNCSDVMKSGKYGPVGVATSIFKPQYREDTLSQQEVKYRHNVYLLHLIAIAPLLLYVGLRGLSSNPKVFPVVAAIGGIAALYHGTRLFIPRT